MAFQFHKHYSLEEARALLPQVRGWLKQLVQLREQLSQSEPKLGPLLAAGNDLGGELVNNWIRSLCRIQAILQEFQQRQIQIKDLDRGLLDFPAVIGGKEVFLCWEQDEEDIEYWHDLDTGYAGRERL